MKTVATHRKGTARDDKTHRIPKRVETEEARIMQNLNWNRIVLSLVAALVDRGELRHGRKVNEHMALRRSCSAA